MSGETEDPLAAAHEAVRRAQTLDDLGQHSQAEGYWVDAERLYEAAGVDAEWFDHAAVADALDEAPPKMDIYWIFPTRAVEVTFEPGDEAPAGVVALADDLVDVEP